MFNVVGIEYNKCRRTSSEDNARSTYNLISYWLMKTWPGTILLQELHYGVVVLTFSFLQRCTLKLKTSQVGLIRITYHLLFTKENILTTGTVNDVINAHFQISASYLINSTSTPDSSPVDRLCCLLILNINEGCTRGQRCRNSLPRPCDDRL